MSEQRLLDPDALEPEVVDFYRGVMITLNAAGIPFLVGGGYALRNYTGITRDTKDLDLFVLPAHIHRIMQILPASGYEAELKFPHWLGKARRKENVVDLIFSSGNGLCRVDEVWFEHGVESIAVGLPVKLSPPEEMIWQKAFIMERHRYDGADVVHLLHACGVAMDWTRLLARFGPQWPVLLSHMILAQFVFPNDDTPATRRTFTELLSRFSAAMQSPPPEPGAPVCQGTLLSLLEYLPAVEQWGFRDARLPPVGNMTSAEIDHWTNTFEK